MKCVEWCCIIINIYIANIIFKAPYPHDPAEIHKKLMEQATIIKFLTPFQREKKRLEKVTLLKV